MDLLHKNVEIILLIATIVLIMDSLLNRLQNFLAQRESNLVASKDQEIQTLKDTIASLELEVSQAKEASEFLQSQGF